MPYTYEAQSRLTGTPDPVASLLYGAGLCLTESVRLHVKDLDFKMNQIVVREGKGEKDRITTHIIDRGGNAVRSSLD